MNPAHPEITKLTSGKLTLMLKMGLEKVKEVEIEMDKGKFVSGGVAAWNFDCTHNNDLVDYFKTMFEG